MFNEKIVNDATKSNHPIMWYVVEFYQDKCTLEKMNWFGWKQARAKEWVKKYDYLKEDSVILCSRDRLLVLHYMNLLSRIQNQNHLGLKA